MPYAWTCSCCGKQYSTLPLNFAAQAPDYWFEIAPHEREARAFFSSDFCTIDGEYHYVRGCLEVPIVNAPETFVFGVWVSLSEASMKRAAELWDAEVSTDEPPRYGWLSTKYPRTVELKAAVHFRSGGLRPLVWVEPGDHPLAIEQERGITMERVQEIVAALTHRN